MFRKNAPINGVFAVTLTGIDGLEYEGIANVGTRPTVDGGSKVILEAHLFDFDKEIYGCYVEVHFKQKIRDELRFKSLDALKAQIVLDVVEAKAIFTEHNKIATKRTLSKKIPKPQKMRMIKKFKTRAYNNGL
jgi:riboflavin kinase/FMN adenylyltransferase